MATTQHIHNALHEVQSAGYLLSVAYHITKEPKTLLLVADHALSSFMFSVSALLAFERAKKTILPYHDTVESKFNAFKETMVKKYNLHSYAQTIREIMELLQERKEAPVEFSKDMNYVICSDQYEKIRTVSETDVKRYIQSAKEFAAIVQSVISHE